MQKQVYSLSGTYVRHTSDSSGCLKEIFVVYSSLLITDFVQKFRLEWKVPKYFRIIFWEKFINFCTVLVSSIPCSAHLTRLWREAAEWGSYVWHSVLQKVGIWLI